MADWLNGTSDLKFQIIQLLPIIDLAVKQGTSDTENFTLSSNTSKMK